MLTEQNHPIVARGTRQKPLVVNITNYVVMNNATNALLAIGFAYYSALRELAEMMSFSGALVINIGTLDNCLDAKNVCCVKTSEREQQGLWFLTL